MKSHFMVPIVMVAALLLGGCGSNSDGGSSSGSGTQGDAFVSYTREMAANAPDEDEAFDVDAIVETAPEDTEPEDVG